MPHLYPSWALLIEVVRHQGVSGLVSGDGPLVPRDSAFDDSRGPRRIRSRASSRSLATMTSRLWRTATIVASLMRLARSSPEKPGAPREMAVRSTAVARCLLPAWVAKNGRSFQLVGEWNLYLKVETARSQERTHEG
jgi:hypothetical protein